MAITIRYFSTSSAGAGDGTSWANRAALFSGGAWSTVITAFDFTSNSLLCYVGPGTYTITAALASASFSAGGPIVNHALFFHGCDSNGALLSLPDPDWKSCEPVTWDSSLPVLATTTNINTVASTLVQTYFRLFKFTASGATTNAVLAAGVFDWCSIYHSGSNNSAVAITNNVFKLSNVYISMSGNNYSCALQQSSGHHVNVRIQGVVGVAGNRNGVLFTGGSSDGFSALITVFGCGGAGWGTSASAVANRYYLWGCAAINNGSDGITLPSTASQTQSFKIINGTFTGNAGYGVNAGAANCYIGGCRFRDNTLGATNAFGDFPITFDVYTTDDADSTEYVDPTSTFDFTILPTAPTWQKGYGTKDRLAFGGAFAAAG